MQAKEAWEKATVMDPLNRFAWSNLAFLHCANLVPLKPGETNWQATIRICNNSVQAIEEHSKRQGIGASCRIDAATVTCHSLWSYAEFKQGLPASAIKQVKKAIDLCPDDPANWVLWGVILRSVGNYKSSRAKLERALCLDPENAAAKFELNVLDLITQMDETFELD